jgi:hypothetical protein
MWKGPSCADRLRQKESLISSVILVIILCFFLSGKLRLWVFEEGSKSDVGVRFALRILRGARA